MIEVLGKHAGGDASSSTGTDCPSSLCWIHPSTSTWTQRLIMCVGLLSIPRGGSTFSDLRSGGKHHSKGAHFYGHGCCITEQVLARPACPLTFRQHSHGSDYEEYRMAQTPLLIHLLQCFSFYHAPCIWLLPCAHSWSVNVAADALSCNNLPLFFSLAPQVP